MTYPSFAEEQSIRVEKLRRQMLLETAMLNRDLRIAIRAAITELDRKAYNEARLGLLQALDEMPFGQRRRER